MRLLVSIYVVSARGRHGRRHAMSRRSECSARPRVSRISTGSLVRFVALLVRFTAKVTHQSPTRLCRDARAASGRGANASVSGGIATKGGARTSVRVPGLRRFVRPIGPTTPLPLPGAHCGGKAGRATEIALDGLHLLIANTEILHIAERLTVFSSIQVHHKRVIAVSDHPFQIKSLYKINLRFPTSRFESALTDVVVVVCARKCEVVRQQGVDRMPVPLLPCGIVIADRFFFFRAQPCLRVRTGNSGGSPR